MNRDAPEFRSGRNSGRILRKNSGPVPAGTLKKTGPEPEFSNNSIDEGFIDRF